MHLLVQKQYIDVSVRYHWQKNVCWFIHDIIIPKTCVTGDDVLNEFGNIIPMKIWKYCICFLNLLLVFDC